MTNNPTPSVYEKLAERINRFPQGAPPGELLYSILKMLFSEEEAALVSLMPIKPFTAQKAARIWKMPEAKARIVLEKLAARGLLLDIDKNGDSEFILPPPMAGFIEFSLMRVRTDIDQKVLSELFYQYLNVEEDFVHALFVDGETKLGRIFINEPVVPPDFSQQVLDYERASAVITSARQIGIGICYCRHKMKNSRGACSAPLDICMTFNSSAESMNKHGITRSVDAAECLDLLQKARSLGLVQFGDNMRQNVNFICNCCGCCCEALLAARRFGHQHPLQTTNYMPAIDNPSCTGCGKCVEACPVGAMSLASAGDPKLKKKKMAVLIEDLCLGCGVCVPVCPQKAVKLVTRPMRIIPPLNAVHRAVMMAIERGKLQNLIFDNQALRSHRVMAAILGVILKLPPLKQAMATRQVKSRYMEYLISKINI